MSKIRDINTSQKEFVYYSDRIMTLLVEESLSYLPHSVNLVKTKCGM